MAPVQVRGEAPGEADLAAIAPEEAEAAQVPECEGAVGAVAQDAPINT